jgi:Flp pilus assembly protein TadB
MAQTRRRRRRKRRGTQAGTIDRRASRGRPRSRQEARARAKSQMGQRNPRDRPPSWRGAMNRAAVGAALVLAFFVLLLGQPVLPSIGLTIAMFAFYVPLGYLIDRFFYTRRQAAKRKAAEKAKR